VPPTGAFVEQAALPTVTDAYLTGLCTGSGFGVALARSAPRIERLTLHHCGLDADDAAAVAALPRLETLQLSAVGIDGLLPPFATTPGLRELRLDNGDATDVGVAALAGHPSLQRLDLRGTGVTDAVCATLATMPRLAYVDVCATAVSDAAIAALLAARPSVRVLH
jgi:hypothetical protein